MDADSAQEKRFPIQQDIRAAYLNRAESDAVFEMVGLAGDLDAIEFRIFRSPKRQVGAKGKLGVSFGICLKCFAETRLGNSNGDILLKSWPVKLQPAFNLARRPLLQLDK